MKKTITLSIPTPCGEKWESFSHTAAGGFCISCSKTVVDFTSMSDVDIIDFFKSKKSQTCGRFKADQMRSYAVPEPLEINFGFTLIKAGLLSCILLLMSRQASAQTKTTSARIESVPYIGGRDLAFRTTTDGQIVKGIVRLAEDSTSMPGVNIHLLNDTTHTVTDEKGQFIFPKRLKEGDVLQISLIGLTTKNYVVPKMVENALEIEMELEVTQLREVIVGGVRYADKQSGIRRFWAGIKKLF